MRESKNFQTRPEKTDPRRSAWSFVSFDDCKKGETSAKTGCTPASGEGGKKEGEGEAPTNEWVDAHTAKYGVHPSVREKRLEENLERAKKNAEEFPLSKEGEKRLELTTEALSNYKNEEKEHAEGEEKRRKKGQRTLKKGEQVTFKPEHMDPGDEKYDGKREVVEDRGDTVLIRTDLGLAFPSTESVSKDMLDWEGMKKKEGEKRRRSRKN